MFQSLQPGKAHTEESPRPFFGFEAVSSSKSQNRLTHGGAFAKEMSLCLKLIAH